MQFRPDSELEINHAFQPGNTEKPVLFKSNIAEHPDYFRTLKSSPCLFDLNKDIYLLACAVRRELSTALFRGRHHGNFTLCLSLSWKS